MSAVLFGAPFTNFRCGIKDGGAILFVIATGNYVLVTRDSGMPCLDTTKTKGQHTETRNRFDVHRAARRDTVEPAFNDYFGTRAF
jgi:hypothetical protein